MKAIVEHPVIAALRENSALTASKRDAGGHGGNHTAIITIGEEKHDLFLKPVTKGDKQKIDRTEITNYQIIERLSPELAKFMPKFYGEVTLDGKTYLVMENSCSGGKIPLADIKLAGKTEDSKFNPIANQGEMRKTRGKPKSEFKFWLMRAQARSSPEYMIAKGMKFQRTFNYAKSNETLKEILMKYGDDKISNLKTKINALRKALNESNVALIGASIILIPDDQGGIKPLLIDPAHMIINPEKENDLKQINGKIYFGSGKEYLNQQMSNQISLGKLFNDISAIPKKPPPSS